MGTEPGSLRSTFWATKTDTKSIRRSGSGGCAISRKMAFWPSWIDLAFLFGIVVNLFLLCTDYLLRTCHSMVQSTNILFLLLSCFLSSSSLKHHNVSILMYHWRKKGKEMGGCIAQGQHTWFSLSSPGLFYWHSQECFLLMLPRFFDGTAWNSGHRLDNVNRTHLVLASGKPELKKRKSKRGRERPIKKSQSKSLLLIRHF